VRFSQRRLSAARIASRTTELALSARLGTRVTAAYSVSSLSQAGRKLSHDGEGAPAPSSRMASEGRKAGRRAIFSFQQRCASCLHEPSG